jgi:peptidoglycan/LPS O-acetylase OafA/YrhL
VDRKYILTSLLYAMLGMVLGILMAASKNHGQFVTHAHIMLVGFVVSFIYGLCHRLWLGNNAGALAQAQFHVHQIGAAVMSVGLFLLYGNYVSVEAIDPILAVSSLAILIGMMLMAILFVRSNKND